MRHALRLALALSLAALTLAAALPSGAVSLKEGMDALGIGQKPDTSRTGSPASLSSSEIDGGLRQALEKAVRQSIDRLGRTDGYLKDPLARIELPGSLQTVGKGLKAVGQGAVVDDFVASMNHAAEKAVPETVNIFMDAISRMTVADGKAIVNGPDDAATTYFEKTSRGKLKTRILPIVAKATDEAGVTGSYKSMARAAGPLSGGLGGAPDLDDYVAEKGLDGLFKVMATYEKDIRTDPAARTTDLLRKVFGTR